MGCAIYLKRGRNQLLVWHDEFICQVESTLEICSQYIKPRLCYPFAHEKGYCMKRFVSVNVYVAKECG